jgi:hypothetical protein
MAKFVNSNDAISSSLLLWNEPSTQLAIEETYNLKVYPVTSLLNDNPCNFVIPSQPRGLLNDIHIVTKFKIQKNGEDIIHPQKDISVVNNFANALWAEVSVIMSDRTELCQSMRNSYAYQTFFNHALNSDQQRAKYLFENELFLLDQGVSKKSEEDLRVFWKWDHSKDYFFDGETFTEGQEETKKESLRESYWQSTKITDPSYIKGLESVVRTIDGTLSDNDVKIQVENRLSRKDGWIPTRSNPAASIRSQRINSGQSVIINSRFQCPLLNTSKCLPTNVKLRISLTKNKDQFLLLCDEDAGYSVVVEDCHLVVSYYRVRDEILNLMEEKLKLKAASYTITRPEILIKPVTHSGRIIRMSNIFHDKLPSYAFFALQKSADFEGTHYSKNGFIFVPYQKFNFYRNGVPYFIDSLEASTVTEIREGDFVYDGIGEYLRQLYQTIGKDSRGNCLIDSSNFHLNFMVGISFGADRSSLAERHLNLQEKASTYLEIDMGADDVDVPEDLVLIVYSLYDRQVLIDSQRIITLVD